jgi:hypothetical protein
MAVDRIGARVPAGRLLPRPAMLCAVAVATLILAAGAALRHVNAQTETPAPAAAPQSDPTAATSPATDENPPSADENTSPAAAAPVTAPEENPPAAAAPVAAPTKPAASTPEEQRKQEVATECSDLLKMATDLKTAVDKTTKDELSVTVVRKASEIEQFAHKVRDDTRLTAGRN